MGEECLTVLVKAVNQSVPDHSVTCEYDWPVIRLKENLLLIKEGPPVILSQHKFLSTFLCKKSLRLSLVRLRRQPVYHLSLSNEGGTEGIWVRRRPPGWSGNRWDVVLGHSIVITLVFYVYSLPKLLTLLQEVRYSKYNLVIYNGFWLFILLVTSLLQGPCHIWRVLL